MDDKGFIFTVDAALALIVVFVFTGSIVTYSMLPIYQGEDHEHLESLASSVLDTMSQNGMLLEAAVEYSNDSQNLTSSENTYLQNYLNSVIPSSIAYNLTIGTNPPVTVGNTRGLNTANDQVTKVEVISGPQEGWMGRAYYVQDQVNFTNVSINATTTVSNFHDYLQNFQPWGDGGAGTYLNSYPYWGGTNPTGSHASCSNTYTYKFYHTR